jgi:hypothetical protein
VHVLTCCASVQGTRVETGIARYLADCKEAGLSTTEAHSAFLNGKESDNLTSISHKEHMGRAESLLKLQDTWLAIWDKVNHNLNMYIRH